MSCPIITRRPDVIKVRRGHCTNDKIVTNHQTEANDWKMTGGKRKEEKYYLRLSVPQSDLDT